ncbi:MAG TPA: ATP-dependent Clp protease ATP-binding subunit, partial [Myxococcota bacterium]|nr:ATP-dependent Clp protease ATP-binding subunit [Myxococcota bacterium]
MQFATDSGEAVQAYIEAENLATRASQPLSSVHLLMALFAFPNRAQVLLLERGIDVERVRRELGGPAEEPKRTLQRIKDRAR